MYNAGGYGFGNPAFNNTAPQQQQGQQQQPGGQPSQQAMYNQQQQQFAGMTPQGTFAPGHGGNPQMMAGTGHPGMMQNAGMPNMQGMTGNGQMSGYQQFPGASYGQVLPSSVNPQNFAPNNYMMGAGMQGFPMNQASIQQQQQQMMQRMQQQQQHQQQQQRQQPQQQHHQQQQQPQPQQQQHQQPQSQQQQQQLPQQQQQPQQNQVMAQASTPQRPSSAQQGTPNNAGPNQQAQFATPQPPSQGQTPSHAQHPMSQQGTPQTPTFPNKPHVPMPGAQPAMQMSPASDNRDKERFALLLDINHELLYESIQIQTTQQEIKKEFAAQGQPADRKPSEEETMWQQDYLQCMRRLQGNLTYMAALADRKPEAKVPPCPAYLTAPPLTLTLRPRAQPIAPEGVNYPLDPFVDRDQRDKSIKELYERLQQVFPGFDPKNEPAYGKMGAGQKPGNAPMNQASPTTQKTPQMGNMPAPPMNQGGGMP